jgi:hypothetical protein
MGIVFGKTGVLEPPFQVLLTRSPAAPSTTPYQLRNYGVRYACETIYDVDKGGSDSTGFRALAGYIGVGTSPQNTISQGISMTAPVVTTSSSSIEGQAISMTAPVVTTNIGQQQDPHQSSPSSSSLKKMAFLLPQEYNSLDKIPQPTNPNVKITKIPAAQGAVHTFSGWCNDARAKSKARELVHQLQEDGVDMDEEDALAKFELWQFHPPFTIPMLRKNEVWIELSEDQVNGLLKKYTTTTMNH